LAPTIVVAVPPAIGPVFGFTAPTVTNPALADRSATEASGMPPALAADTGAPAPVGAETVLDRPGTWAGDDDHVVVEVIMPGTLEAPGGSSAWWTVLG
jgi:hypothetical protein